MEPYRILLIISFLLWFKKTKRDPLHTLLIWYVLLSSFSLLINHGLSVAIQSGGILYLETCTSYMLGLAYIRNSSDHKRYFKLLSFMFLIISVPAIIEFTTGYKIIHDFFEKLTGNKQLAANLYTSDYVRLGFTRATAVFSHPILYAISAVTIIPIVIAINKNDKQKFSASLVNLSGFIVAIITAMTSAAISALVLQQGLKKWYRITNKSIKNAITFMGIVAMLVIQLGSNRGLIKFIAMTVTLDPRTAYYRILQWEFASDDIANNIFFGVGNNGFTHPDWFAESIDSYWLLNILQYGIFSEVALIYFFVKLLKKTFIPCETKERKELLIAYRVVIISVLFSGLTVDYFDRMQPILYFILGSSSWLMSDLKRGQDANKNIIK